MSDYRDDEMHELQQRLRDLRQQAAAALLEADEERAELATDAADVLLVQLAQRQAERAAAERSEQASIDARATAINREFAESFSDVLANDGAFIDAQALMEVRLSDSRFASMTPDQLAQEVGTAVRRAHAPQPQPTPVEPARAEVQQAPDVQSQQRASRQAYVAQRLATQYRR